MGSFEESLAHGTLWVFIVAFGSGIATSLTPCVYPMIPITVSIFGATEARSRTTALLLALTYVMGIALTYAGLGVLASLAGWAAPGALLSSPWFVVPLSLLFLALATSMFGLWEIRLPAGLQTRLSTVGGKGFRGAFAMGLVGGIIIAPCTGPWLAGLLGYVATTRSVLLGGGLLFTYALGIGVLFLVLAAFAISLPKSGAWMDGVKSALGIALVAATLYYLQNVLEPLSRYASGEWWFAGLNVGLVVVGAGAGGVHLSFRGGTRLRIARKTAGIMLLSLGIFGLVNFALTPGSKLPWIVNDESVLLAARRSRQPVLIDFWATWCTPCKQIEATVLNHPAVRRELARFALLKVDVGQDKNVQVARLQRTYGKALPLLVLIDSAGNERARLTHVTASQMLQLLRDLR